MKSQQGQVFDDARRYEHWRKYEQIAQAIGIGYLILRVPCKSDESAKEEILAAYARDPALNTISLRRWDIQDNFVRALARKVFLSWSLSDTVCTLKHVAKYHLAGIPAPAEVVDELSQTRRSVIDREFHGRLRALKP